MAFPLRTVSISFTSALVIGWFAGRASLPDSQPAGDPPISFIAERQTSRKPASLDCDQLLREINEMDSKEEETGADALVDLLAEWSEPEIRAALEEALRTSTCVDRSGSHSSLPWKLFTAWMKKNPDTAVTWIDTLKSAQLRDGFVREAIRQWPQNRLMEGIDFLLAHHWKSGDSYSGTLIRRSFESEAAISSTNLQKLLDRLYQAKVDPQLESINLPSEFDFRSMVESESFRAQSEDSFQNVVLADWRIKQPERFLEWMKDTGTWKHFNEFLTPNGNPAAAARFWEQADPGTRESVASKISWKDLGDEGSARFARLIGDEGTREAWLTECLQASFRTGELNSATILELIPSTTRRGEILRSLFPTTDFNPASPIRFNDPTHMGQLRELIGALGISVPPPIMPDLESDPFANPR